jgi:hypothetical protein
MYQDPCRFVFSRLGKGLGYLCSNSVWCREEIPIALLRQFGKIFKILFFCELKNWYKYCTVRLGLCCSLAPNRIQR